YESFIINFKRVRLCIELFFYEQIPNNKIPSFRNPLICYDKCTKLVTYWVQRIEETGEADE
ncbi:hypothetical protein, partial [Bacillus paranthracis]